MLGKSGFIVRLSFHFSDDKAFAPLTNHDVQPSGLVCISMVHRYFSLDFNRLLGTTDSLEGLRSKDLADTRSTRDVF